MELGEKQAAEQEIIRLIAGLLDQRERFEKTFGEGAAMRSLGRHRMLIIFRPETARNRAVARLLEPTERLENLLNTTLLLELALPEKALKPLSPSRENSGTDQLNGQ